MVHKHYSISIINIVCTYITFKYLPLVQLTMMFIKSNWYTSCDVRFRYMHYTCQMYRNKYYYIHLFTYLILKNVKTDFSVLIKAYWKNLKFLWDMKSLLLLTTLLHLHLPDSRFQSIIIRFNWKTHYEQWFSKAFWNESFKVTVTMEYSYKTYTYFIFLKGLFNFNFTV